MNTVRIGILCCLAFSLASCSQLKAITSKPIVKDVVGNLKDAIQDIDPAGVAKDQLCAQYRRKGVILAEAAWDNVWPSFAPIWATSAGPGPAKLYCENLIREAGATIVQKKSDSGAASAVCFQAQFPKDFASKSLEEQAAITCHEAFHLVQQKSVGCKDWLALYFSTISARLTFEGTAYVLSVALLELFGWSSDLADAYLAKRAERFPERYAIPREAISDECTLEHWTAIRGALRERAGV